MSIAPAGHDRRRQAGRRSSPTATAAQKQSATAGFAPSRICRARPRHSTRRWRRSRLNPTVIASQRVARLRADAKRREAIHRSSRTEAGLLRCARNDEKQKSEETTMSQAKRVVLVSRPVGEPKASDFRIEEYAPPTPGEGQVLLRTIWLSLDPYMRGRMSDGPSYAAPVPIGGVMEGGTVSEVIASNNPGFAKGDIVLSRAGWQTHALSDGKGLAQDRSEARTGLDRGRRARHARHDRLYRAARHRQAAGRRDRGGRGGLRRGRLGGRADRQDQGRARRRHRRRQGQMRLRQDANSASTTASITAIPIWRRS